MNVMEPETKQVPGKLVVFLIGRTSMNLEASEVVEIKPLKSAPAYPDVIPKQKVIKLEKRVVDDSEVAFLVKAYLPDVVVVEATVETGDLLAAGVLDFKRKLIGECRKILEEFNCDREFDEEYSVYCI